jgi:uncharacterized protein (DUF486 family)
MNAFGSLPVSLQTVLLLLASHVFMITCGPPCAWWGRFISFSAAADRGVVDRAVSSG